MKYGVLIRKLIQASEDAKWQRTDIADVLKDRCIRGTDIIRQTLMNTVCDPRFKMHVDTLPSPGWKPLVRTRLEMFVRRLMAIPNLTEERALDEMDMMLNDWFRFMVKTTNEINNKITFVTFDASHVGKSIKRALDEFVNGKSPKPSSVQEQALSWSGEDTPHALEYDDKEDEENSTDKKSILSQQDSDTNKDDDDSQQKVSGQLIINSGPGDRVELENRFLKSVPPSLIELAKRIGRSAQVEGMPTGTFLSASKSDISGITTGNNLSCLLPVELALMADRQTENIFYKNFVTRNLQLFASASHMSRSKTHRNGPIIICLDTSLSMQGEPLLVAEALTFAICIIAQRKKRPVVIVKYSESHTPFFLHNLNRQRAELQDFLSVAEQGGNNEDSLFNWLFTELLPNEEELQSGDVLTISDFGWMPISPQTMTLIKKAKAQNMLFYGLKIKGNGMFDEQFFKSLQDFFKTNHDFGRPKDVCDSLWVYDNGVCAERSFDSL